MQLSQRLFRAVSGPLSARTEVTRTNFTVLGVYSIDSWYSLVLKFLAWVLILGWRMRMKWDMVAEVLSRFLILCEFYSCWQSISLSNSWGSMQQMRCLSWKIMNSQTRLSMAIIYLQIQNMLDGSRGAVLPLISEDQQGKLSLNPSTVVHLAQFKGPYCFVSICGDYRSGKSFLLNSLFFDYKGFQTSGTTQACTKGINIWSKPIQKKGVLIWLLDTEGFGSTEKDSNYDGKIFLLSLLISNVLLYNSFGAIDENSITKLGMVCSQAHLISPKYADVKLFWILRDFSLEMIDRKGRKLTSDEYLEECLKEEGNHNKAEKELLKRLFAVRHCVPLIRPVIDEKTLSNLKGLSKQELREQFKEEVKQLSVQVDGCIEGKEIGGVSLDQGNLEMVLKEFVDVLNSGSVNFQLTNSYEKIKEYQQEMEKQKIISMINHKIEKVKNLLPVNQEHIRYLQSQIKQLIVEQVQLTRQHSSKQYCEMLELSLSSAASLSVQKIELSNKVEAENQIKDYLYRQMIELYPSLITLTVGNFQQKFQDYGLKLRKDCSEKYQSYFKEARDLDSIYSVFMEKEGRKLFYQLIKRWKTAYKDFEEKLEEVKRSKAMSEDELTRIREEKRKVAKNLEEYRREEGRSLSKLKIQMEETYKEELMTVVTEYEVRLKACEESRAREVAELKAKIQGLEQQKLVLSSSIQYERQSLLEKVALEQQKSELSNIKYEQLKGSLELQLEQLKSSYQNKLKILQIKNNETNSTLLSERKKFQLLTEERRMEEAQIMDELAEKNQKIEYLTNELLKLEEKYKLEMENILNEEKDILVKTISNKISQYEYKCKIYEGQLEQSAATIQELQFYQQRCDQLQLQSRELKRREEEDSDKINLLNGKLKKLESELAQKERSLQSCKQSYEKELSLASETNSNNAKFIKEVEVRHQEELQYYQRKVEVALAEQSQSLAETHEANLRQNKVILQQKFARERSQLKEIISNNYEQIERLQLRVTYLKSEVDKMNLILLKIRNRHQGIGQSAQKQRSSSRSHTSPAFNPFSNGDDLVHISQSPEEESLQESSEKRDKFESAGFIIEQVQAIFDSMRQQIQLLEVERSELRTQLDENIEQVQYFEKITSKTKGENREYASEMEVLRNKSKLLEAMSEDYRSMQTKVDELSKENFQLKSEADLKGQAAFNRQGHFKETIALHKETIGNLAEQNKRLGDEVRTLTQKISELESELERFKLWAEVQSRQSHSSSSAREGMKVDESVSKIKDLEGQLKRLISKVQEQKIAQAQRQSKRENRLSNLMTEHRLDELTELRKENQELYRQLKQCHQKELKLMEQSKLFKQQQAEYEQSRYQSVTKELLQVRQNAKQVISRIQAQLQIHIEEKRHLQKEFNDLQQNFIKKYELNEQLMQEEIRNLKKDKEGLTEIYSKKVALLQETLNNKVSQLQRKLAETQLQSEKEREEIEKEQRRVGLEGERHRMKYEQLLKVNNELVKEIQGLKSKAHQITLKEKYKEKISRLFTDD